MLEIFKNSKNFKFYSNVMVPLSPSKPKPKYKEVVHVMVPLCNFYA